MQTLLSHSFSQTIGTILVPELQRGLCNEAYCRTALSRPFLRPQLSAAFLLTCQRVKEPVPSLHLRGVDLQDWVVSRAGHSAEPVTGWRATWVSLAMNERLKTYDIDKLELYKC